MFVKNCRANSDSQEQLSDGCNKMEADTNDHSQKSNFVRDRFFSADTDFYTDDVDHKFFAGSESANSADKKSSSSDERATMEIGIFEISVNMNNRAPCFVPAVLDQISEASREAQPFYPTKL